MEDNSAPDWQQVAAQLRKPTGEAGIRTGHSMNQANTGMTMAAFERLGVATGERLLEIGPGNGEHVAVFVARVAGLRYEGIDISDTMVEEAERSFLGEPDVNFSLSDGSTISFADDSFDKILTVNTLYFWEDPEVYAREIRRVLRPGGTLCLAFALRSFMEHLPFTAFGFQLYEPDEVEKILKTAGFAEWRLFREKETIRSNTGEEVEREYALLVASC